VAEVHAFLWRVRRARAGGGRDSESKNAGRGGANDPQMRTEHLVQPALVRPAELSDRQPVGRQAAANGHWRRPASEMEGDHLGPVDRPVEIPASRKKHRLNLVADGRRGEHLNGPRPDQQDDCQIAHRVERNDQADRRVKTNETLHAPQSRTLTAQNGQRQPPESCRNER
jgi:hypothetical protein